MEPEATRVYITILIAGVIFCLVVIVFIITIVSYQKKSVAAYLDTVKADLNLWERASARMAFDMHDELNSNLSAVKLMLDDLEPGDDKTKRQVAKISAVISDTMITVRQLSKKLVPLALEREGLLGSLDSLIDLLFAGSSLEVVSHWQVAENDIPDENKIYIYRIVQELLSNSIKHSGAHHIRVSLEREEKTIRLGYQMMALVLIKSAYRNRRRDWDFDMSGQGST